MSRFFLIPILLTLLWTAVLFHFGLSMKQGRRGYYLIIGISLVIVAFFSLMIYLTRA